MINKKAQIAETITWVAAFLIIFFIMVIFAGTAGLLAQGKSALKSAGVGSNKIYSENVEMTNKSTEKNAMALLNSQIEYGGGAASVRDVLILGATNENLKIIGGAIGESCDKVVLVAGSMYLVKEKGKSSYVSEEIPNLKLFSSASISLGRNVKINYWENGCKQNE